MALARLRRNSLFWASLAAAVTFALVAWVVWGRGCRDDATFPVIGTGLEVVGALLGAMSLIKIGREALAFHLAQMRAKHYVLHAEPFSIGADVLSASATTRLGPNATTEQRLEALERKVENLSTAVESVDKLTRGLEILRADLNTAQERARQGLEDAKREARDTEKRQFPWLALGLFLVLLGATLANIGNVLAGCR